MNKKCIIKDTNYIVLEGWMVTKLNLSGTDLHLFAMIYGFCQNQDSKFMASLEYMSQWTKSTKKNCIEHLKNLQNMNLIIKEQSEDIYHHTPCIYNINWDTLEKILENNKPINNLLTPINENTIDPLTNCNPSINEKLTPINNLLNNNKDYIEVDIKEKKEVYNSEFNNSQEQNINISKKTFVNNYTKKLENEKEQKNKQKRVNRITKNMKLEDLIKDFTTNEDVIEKLEDYLEFRQKQGLTYASWKSILTNFFNKFGNKSVSQQLEQIDYCFRKSYRDLDYANNFSGNIKTSYGSSYDELHRPSCPDNCANHDTSDEPKFNNMNKEQKQKWEDENLAKDENGNFLVF